MPTSQSFNVTDDVSGQLVSGTVQVDPTGTIATFVPQQALAVDHQFQVTLSSTTQDSSGNGLSGSGTSFSFTTAFAPDTTSPRVLGVSPANGATAVPTNALVVLTFSKPLDPISVTTSFQVESAGQPVAGGIALSNGNEQITFTPQGGLAGNTTYSVVVPAQITDVGGLALSNPATYTFVTGSATDSSTPTVTLVSPANYAVGLPTNGEVQLQFSKPINPLTVISLNAVTSNYSYDPLYELTQVTQGASTTETYSYDAVGNRLSSSGVPTYNYNTSNELTSNSNGSYTYDNNGNTLTDASGKTYTWDFENRLTQAVVPGTGTTTFKYDPFGRRIQKAGPLGTTNYLYDGNGENVIEEVDSNGNTLARYAELALDEPYAELRSGTASYYQQDGLDSVTSLTNSAGVLANTSIPKPGWTFTGRAISIPASAGS